MNGKRTLGRILGGLTLAVSFLIAWNASKIFTMTGFFQTLATQFLGAHVDERYAGGPVAAKFRDMALDDNGGGDFTYPLAEAFQSARVLDLLGFTVHKPNTGSIIFMEERFFWQFDYTFASLGPAVIRHYISIDSSEGSSTESPDGAEGLSFDPGHPWSWMIEIDVEGGKATAVNAAGDIEKNCTVYRVEERNTVLVRLSLDLPGVVKVLDGRSTWHYVVVGGWDDYARGHFIPINEAASLRAGGGAFDRAAPNVYDWLAPKGIKQSDVLASFTGGADVVLPAVEVKPGAAATAGIDGKKIAELEAAAKTENETLAAQALGEAQRKIDSADREYAADNDLADAWLTVGNPGQAEACVDAVLKQTPDDIHALAAKGMLVAMKGGQAKSTAEAVDLVNKAFVYLDQSVKLADAKGPGTEAADAWTAWGSIAISVPEVPFGKSLTGAYYFVKAADYWALSRKTDPEACKREGALLMLAARALEIAQSPSEAEGMRIRASSLPALSAQTRLELAQKGFE